MSSAVREEAYVGYKMKLSEYGLFQGQMNALKLADGVMPYGLNTPLFTGLQF